MTVDLDMLRTTGDTRRDAVLRHTKGGRRSAQNAGLDGQPQDGAPHLQENGMGQTTTYAGSQGPLDTDQGGSFQRWLEDGHRLCLVRPSQWVVLLQRAGCLHPAVARLPVRRTGRR